MGLPIKAKGEGYMNDGNFFDDWQELSEVENPDEFITGCIVEITSKRADRIVVRRYYLNEYNKKMDEEVTEYPMIEKRNKKNILQFLQGAKSLVRKKYGEDEQLYINKSASTYLKKVM